MNNKRRKELRAAISSLETIRDTIDGLKEEEQEAYDNLPEGIQDGESGEVMCCAIDSLDMAYGSIEDAIDYINDAIG